jgi:cyanophycinase
MTMLRNHIVTTLSLAVMILLLSATSSAKSFTYKRLGNAQDAQTTPKFGIAMMGGGTDLDEAFRWLGDKASGGDFLVLRAHGSDDYNPYVKGLSTLNSVSTLVIPDKETAQDPKVAEIIHHAEAIFIAGGDQSLYVNFWQGTPVQEAINAHIAAGKPIGGTSAGLAVQGEFVFACLADKPDDPNLSSAQVLANPYFYRVTIVRDYLKIPLLEGLITDSHFAKRDRLGRSLGFLSRIAQDGWAKNPREIAIDEKSALLVEADGKSRVIGSGKGVYFLRVTEAPKVCQKDQPLTFHNISAYLGPTGSTFDLPSWTGTGGESYTLEVDAGKVHSNRPGNALY